MADESWGLTQGSEIDPSLVVISHLGGGSRYEVYRAWDRVLFCQVAVKVIRPNRVGDAKAMEGFDREVRIAARFTHPNLVRILRVQRSGQRPHIVFEYITAQTLADHLANIGPVSVPELCLLGIRMCSALHYLHAGNVVHLDVKPDNLTLGDPPRLLDLGIARELPVTIRRGMGTAGYMPPEQCVAGDRIGIRSDLFALGATLYEGVSGMQPFSIGVADAPEPEREYPQLVEDAVPLQEVTRVPRRLSQIVMAALEKDPERRPPSAAAFAIALQGVLEDMRIEELYAWPKGLAVQPR